MKIGVLTDIHNNVIALGAVLQEFDKHNCVKIVCAGDIIGIGPYPEETVQKMMTIPNLVAVRGNHEKYLLEGMPCHCPNEEGMDYDEMEYHKWEHERLSLSSIEFLRGLPYRADFDAAGKSVSVMHYCMDQNRRCISYTPNPREADLLALFPDESKNITIYGHDHTRAIHRIQDRWFINSGSLGCPAKDINVARAAILEIESDSSISVYDLKVKYDAAKVVEDIDRIRYPAYRKIKRIFFGIT